MNHFACFCFLLTIACSATAQTTTVPGYYVTNSSDTVTAQIQLPRFVFSNKVLFIKLMDKVAVLDSTNEKKVFRVKDIKGFGFLYNEHKYRFVAKDFGRENAFSANTHRFYQVLVEGHNSTLYHGVTSVDVHDNIVGITLFAEAASGAKSALYLFARTSPAYMKNRLLEFYKEQAEVHPLINSRFQTKNLETWKNEIIEIVQAANKQSATLHP